MTIRLTPNQYRTLIRSVFLARTVVDRAELQDDTAARDIRALMETVQAAAPAFEAEAMFDGDPGQGAALVAGEQDSLLSILEWYEEYGFWDILEERLAMRDITEERSEAQWHWLPDAEKDKIYEQHLDYYFAEFAERGIINLRLVPPDPDAPPLAPWVPHFGDAPGDGGGPGGSAGGKIIEFPGKRARKPEEPQEP
jgi:hypothetical protein